MTTYWQKTQQEPYVELDRPCLICNKPATLVDNEILTEDYYPTFWCSAHNSPRHMTVVPVPKPAQFKNMCIPS